MLLAVIISSLIASLCFTFAETFDDIFLFVKSSCALVSRNTNKSLRPKEGRIDRLTDRPREWICARSLNSYFTFCKIVVTRGPLQLLILRWSVLSNIRTYIRKTYTGYNFSVEWNEKIQCIASIWPWREWVEIVFLISVSREYNMASKERETRPTVYILL